MSSSYTSIGKFEENVICNKDMFCKKLKTPLHGKGVGLDGDVPSIVIQRKLDGTSWRLDKDVVSTLVSTRCNVFVVLNLPTIAEHVFHPIGDDVIDLTRPNVEYSQTFVPPPTPITFPMKALQFGCFVYEISSISSI